MKKIEFICDYCKKEVSVQFMAVDDQMEKYLLTVGPREFCTGCFDKIFGSTNEIL